MSDNQKLALSVVGTVLLNLVGWVLVCLFFCLSAGAQEVKPPAHRAETRKLVLFAVAQAGLETWDMHQTRCDWLEAQQHPGEPFHEANPLTRALVGHPALLYGQVAVSTVATAFLSYRMGQSKHQWVRRLRYLPQTVQVGASAQGVAYTRLNWKHWR